MLESHGNARGETGCQSGFAPVGFERCFPSNVENLFGGISDSLNSGSPVVGEQERAVDRNDVYSADEKKFVIGRCSNYPSVSAGCIAPMSFW